MNTGLLDELRAKWRAEIIAHYDDLKRKALEDFDSRFEDADNTQDTLPVAETTPGSLPKSRDTQLNGSRTASTDIPTAREMVYSVLPDFIGNTLTQGEIKEKILQRWPGAESKYLGSRISQLLKKMTDDEGRLMRQGRGKRIQDPIVYRMTEAFEETLVKR